MTASQKVTLVECPRDAMQGWATFIPTAQKIAYLNSLLQVGFDVLDFGSFVSPKAIPQMQDTAAVLDGLQWQNSTTKLLAIVANTRGAQQAVAYPQIAQLGFPLSLSQTFQQRNTNASIEDALVRVSDIQNLCVHHQKQLVVYLSMGFGNPYGDDYNEDLVFTYADAMRQAGVSIISLADTVGVATPEQVFRITKHIINALPQVEVGVHLHATAAGWRAKVEAAYNAGCRRFDGALKGFGGCPMAADALVGNLDTQWLLLFFAEHGVLKNIDQAALQQSLSLTDQIFV